MNRALHWLLLWVVLYKSKLYLTYSVDTEIISPMYSFRNTVKLNSALKNAFTLRRFSMEPQIADQPNFRI